VTVGVLLGPGIIRRLTAADLQAHDLGRGSRLLSPMLRVLLGLSIPQNRR
jgi:hypothetical protein